MCPLEEKLGERSKGKINAEWLEQFVTDIKDGHALDIHFEILQQHSVLII